jgi:hypothetical protein
MLLAPACRWITPGVAFLRIGDYLAPSAHSRRRHWWPGRTPPIRRGAGLEGFGQHRGVGARSPARTAGALDEGWGHSTSIDETELCEVDDSAYYRMWSMRPPADRAERYPLDCHMNLAHRACRPRRSNRAGIAQRRYLCGRLRTTCSGHGVAGRLFAAAIRTGVGQPRRAADEKRARLCGLLLCVLARRSGGGSGQRQAAPARDFVHSRKFRSRCGVRHR